MGKERFRQIPVQVNKSNFAEEIVRSIICDSLHNFTVQKENSKMSGSKQVPF